MSIQGGLQGRFDARIYQRKKIGPSPEDPRPEVQKIGPKLEPQRLQIPFILKMFFFRWVNFFFFFLLLSNLCNIPTWSELLRVSLRRDTIVYLFFIWGTFID